MTVNFSDNEPELTTSTVENGRGCLLRARVTPNKYVRKSARQRELRCALTLPRTRASSQRTSASMPAASSSGVGKRPQPRQAGRPSKLVTTLWK
jgi:hypothetical protein